MSSVAAIVVAGGSGDRLGRDGGKQMAPLLDRPVLAWTIEAVAGVTRIGLIVVVCHPDKVTEYRDAIDGALALDVATIFVPGGDTRQASVAAGLAWVAPEFEVVLVHDGARPLSTSEAIAASVEAFEACGLDGLVVGRPSVDTIKVVTDGVVESTPDRAHLWTIQTPQVFGADVLRSAHFAADREGFSGTDDASLVEHVGGRIAVLEGPRDNIKITVPEDLAVAEAIVSFREGARK